ncbi:MAG TPA: ComEC/Rec2 family competence protein [Bacteroidales bacterium]|nr:ComEC/Rec2 family competence protein [Bacteroidales bacterium]
MFWNKYPFARILIPFLSGICFALYFDLGILIPIYVFVVLVLLISAIVFFFQKKLSYRMRWLAGSFIVIFYLLAGYQLTALKNSENNVSYFNKYLADENYALVQLTEPVQIREKVCKCVVDVKAVKDSVQMNQTSGKAIIYFEKDSLSEKLDYGDEVFLNSRFSKVSPPMNPQEYNYKNYLKYRSVEYSGYIKKNNWKLISTGKGNVIYSFAYKLRGKLLHILKNDELQGDELAVVSALLIGYTDNLDPELIRDYQGTGAVHILSVSGLHVGVIFIVLNFLLLFFDKTKYGRIPKAVLLLGFIWFYAVLTGMSPSVMRATAMFSFVIVGNAFRQPPNIYNTIAASAFVLLMFDPYMITAVGFQLSYLAVLGIVALYPYIHKAWTPKYWLLRQLWSLIAVSLAAQLITFPLCLFYFHQFPNYFLLTNIVAVPLSGLIIYLGIAVLVLSFWPWLSLLLARVLSYSLMLLNGSISFIEELPYSVTRAVSVNFIEMMLVYAIIIAFCAFLLQRKSKAFVMSVSFLLLLLVSVTIRNFQAVAQKEIIIYNINKHTAIDLVDGKSAFFICDPALLSDIQKQDFHIMNNRCRSKIRDVNPVVVNDKNVSGKKDLLYFKKNYYYFAGKRLAIVDQATYNTRKLALDYLLISKNPDITIEELLNQYQPGLIIFDASNSVKNITKWARQCDHLRKPYYSTRHSGAWWCDLND